MNIYQYLRMKGTLPGDPSGALGGLPAAPQVPALTPAMIPQFGKMGKGPLTAQQPLPPKGRGFLGAIDDVFGGPDMQNLTPEQQKAARRRGLLAFGAQMLTATDPRGNRAQGLSALGQGVMAGQAGYGQGIEQGMAANQERQRQAMYGALMPQPNESTEQRYNRYLGMFNAALQQGDTEGMKFISQALNTMPKPGAEDRPEAKYQLGPDEMLYLKVPISPEYPNGLKPTGIHGTPGGRGSGAPSEAAQFSMLNQGTNQFQDVRRNFENRVAPIKPVYDMITMALENAPAAAGGDGSAQVNMMYAFVKAMDAASAVREGELRLVGEASPIISKWNKLVASVGGKGPVTSAMLDPEMVRQVQTILQQGAARYEKRMREYRDNAYGEVEDWNKKVRGRYPIAEMNPDRLGEVPSRYYRPPSEVDKRYGGGR